MDLQSYLASAKISLFRFEQLQDYDVANEKESIVYFKATGEVKDEIMKDWWEFIKSKTKSGVVMQRVRLVVEPYTDYTKMELVLHKKTSEHGDDIRIISEPDFKSLNIQLPDFWLIDMSLVLIMEYNSFGEYRGFKVQTDNIKVFIDAKELLCKQSIALR